MSRLFYFSMPFPIVISCRQDVWVIEFANQKDCFDIISISLSTIENNSNINLPLSKAIMSNMLEVWRCFVSEPMGEKAAMELAGMDDSLGKELTSNGYDKVNSILNIFFDSIHKA